MKVIKVVFASYSLRVISLSSLRTKKSLHRTSGFSRDNAGPGSASPSLKVNATYYTFIFSCLWNRPSHVATTILKLLLTAQKSSMNTLPFNLSPHPNSILLALHVKQRRIGKVNLPQAWQAKDTVLTDSSGMQLSKQEFLVTTKVETSVPFRFLMLDAVQQHRYRSLFWSE